MEDLFEAEQDKQLQSEQVLKVFFFDLLSPDLFFTPKFTSMQDKEPDKELDQRPADMQGGLDIGPPSETKTKVKCPETAGELPFNDNVNQLLFDGLQNHLGKYK